MVSMKASVLRKALKLRRFPKMGAIKALLAELGLEHRYIVEGISKLFTELQRKPFTSQIFSILAEAQKI